MNFENFMEAIIKILGVKYPDCKINYRETAKNNGKKLHGIIIEEPGSNIAPVVYVDDLYTQFMDGLNIENVIEQIMDVYEKSELQEDTSLCHLAEFDYVRNRICYKLVNFEKNKEMLQDVPYRSFYDLAIIYYVSIDLSGEAGCLTVNSTLLQKWDVDEARLYELSKINTPQIYKNCSIFMHDLLQRLLGEEAEEKRPFGVTNEEMEDKFPMYIVTNDAQTNGATVLLYDNVWQDLAEKMQGDFYVLPSSIHEVICVPKNNSMDTRGLIQMVREINSNVLQQEEVLSENIYLYHAEEKEIEMITL